MIPYQATNKVFYLAEEAKVLLVLARSTPRVPPQAARRALQGEGCHCHLLPHKLKGPCPTATSEVPEQESIS